MKVTVKANAKINLLLDILSAMENGYHDLFMLMQSIDLCDLVTVHTAGGEKIEITCTEPQIPCDERNLAHKAAAAFFEYTGIRPQGLRLHIEKHIPHSAGLAGGSADAAATVVALKEIFCPQMSDRQIIELCSPIGADVPFCALGGTMLAQYTGTVISHVPFLDYESIVVVKPDCSVSTGAAYAAFDTAQKIRHLDKTGVLHAVMRGDKAAVAKMCDNVFEQLIDVDDRVPIKRVMRENGCIGCCMSGSGPSVYGIFESKADARRAFEQLSERFRHVFLCRSAESGCEVISRE